jgi:AraC-like DNA-binding protein
MKIFSYEYKGCLVHHSIDQRPNEKDFELHAHSYCEIFYFISGAGYYTVEGRNYPLTQGCVLLMRDGEIHKIHLDPDRPYERIAVHFRLDDVLGQSAAYAPLRSLILDRSPGCGNLFLAKGKESASLLDACFSRICRAPQSNEEFGMQLIATLPVILSELYTIRRSTSNEELLSRREGDPALTEVIDYINQNLTAPLHVDALAERFYISRYYLMHLFRAETGYTVLGYITEKRLLLARDLMRSGRSITEACYEAGFTNYSSFLRAFKKYYGTLPSAADILE